MNIDFKNAPLFASHFLSGSSLRNLWNLLRDNGFRVERQFLPKLLHSGFLVVLSLPFVWLEKLLYHRRIQKTEFKPPVIILGYPRSGTTYLIYLLSKDPNLAFCKTYESLGPHVIFTFGRVLRFIAKRTIPKRRPMDNMALGAELPKEEEFALGNMGIESMANACYFPQKFSEYFDRFVLFKGHEKERHNWTRNYTWLVKKLTLKNKGKRLILKSPFNTGRARLLAEVFPNAKFIHIHRHPYAVYSSNERLYEGILPKLAFHKVDNEDMERHVLYTYKASMEQYLKDKAHLPSHNLFELAYEDFFDNQIEILRQIYTQLDLGDFDAVLPIFEQEMRQYDDYKTNKYGLTPEKEQEVFEHWQFAFHALGYEKDHHKRVRPPLKTT